MTRIAGVGADHDRQRRAQPDRHAHFCAELEGRISQAHDPGYADSPRGAHGEKLGDGAALDGVEVAGLIAVELFAQRRSIGASDGPRRDDGVTTHRDRKR